MELIIIIVILYLLFGKKKKKPTKTVKKSSNKNSFGERMDRLTRKGELPYGWAYENREFTEKIEKEYSHFRETYYKEEKNGVLKEYAALKSLILYMEDTKKLCKQKGECFAHWASYMIADPEDLSKLKERREYIENNIDDLLQQEKMLAKLRADLLKIISAEPGVIQATLYKRFNPDMKPQISNELFLMEAQGIIERKKNGRSYALYIK